MRRGRGRHLVCVVVEEAVELHADAVEIVVEGGSFLCTGPEGERVGGKGGFVEEEALERSWKDMTGWDCVGPLLSWRWK